MLTLFNSKQFTLSLIGYFIIRLFSYIFTPSTPLWNGHPLNTAISITIVIVAVYLIYKNDVRGWLVVAGEIILCGGGGLLSVGPIALRSVLLLATLFLYFFKLIQDKKLQKLKIPIVYIITSIIGWAGISALIGLVKGHDLSLIFSDFIPYLFLLYILPLQDLIKDKKFIQLASNFLFATIISNTLLTLFTFASYSSGWLVLQDHYYHWFRDVAGGKITEMGNNFYRIVLNEHLLLVPVLIYFIGKKINKHKISIIPILALSLIMAMNLTRIYYLALIVALLFLFTIKNIRRYIILSTSVLAFIFISFTSLHLIASRGTDLGWAFFGIRLSSIAAPQIEDSSLSRMILLPKITEKIKQSSIIGHGLGDSITIYSPVFKKEITTSQFDWGYLEIVVELGIIGFTLWAILIYIVIKNKKGTTYIAPLIALLVINITSPALFHVFGIMLIAILYTSNSELFYKKI